MKQTSLKSDRVAELVEQITRQTGESKVVAVTIALEDRMRRLESQDRAQRTLDWLRASVWPNLPADQRGKVPSREEQEELLGF